MDAALGGDGDLDSYLAALSAADAEHPTELTGRFGSAQVFQLRLPALRIEQLRRMAAERGVSPGALAVDWVIDRLDREAPTARPGHRADADRHRRAHTQAQPPQARPPLVARRDRAAALSGRRACDLGERLPLTVPSRRGRARGRSRVRPWRVSGHAAASGVALSARAAAGSSARHGLPVSAATGTAAANAR